MAMLPERFREKAMQLGLVLAPAKSDDGKKFHLVFDNAVISTSAADANKVLTLVLLAKNFNFHLELLNLAIERFAMARVQCSFRQSHLMEGAADPVTLREWLEFHGIDVEAALKV